MTESNEQTELKTVEGMYPLDWRTQKVNLKDGRFSHTLRKPSAEEVAEYDRDLQQTIPIGRDGGYELPDPTANEAEAAKFYDKIVVENQGYGESGPPASHKAAAIRGLYQREIYVDEDTDVFADTVPVLEEIGGDTPKFTITHIMRQPSEEELRKYRRRATAGEIKPGKRGKSSFIAKSKLAATVAVYDQWISEIHGVTLDGDVSYHHNSGEFVAVVDPLIKQRVIEAFVDALTGSLLD